MFPSLRVSGRSIIAPTSRRFLSSSIVKFSAGKVSKQQSLNPDDVEALKSETTWGDAESSTPVDLNENMTKITNTMTKSTDPPIYIAPSLHRHFRMGDTYTPFDFSMNRFTMEQKAKNKKKLVDPFAKSGIDPKTLYLMPEILSKFLTSTGQILSRDVTGCSAENQKKLAMAIKYARSLGLLSSKHRHARYMPSRNMWGGVNLFLFSSYFFNYSHVHNIQLIEFNVSILIGIKFICKKKKKKKE